MKRTLLLLVTCLLLLSWPQRAMAEMETAVFAGGCFWCLEHDLEDLPGVRDAVSGYSGGHVENPTYRQVSGETTGHQEVVQVRFDSEEISYDDLLRSYWRNVDPLDGGGQFCDRGDSYRPVIFTASAAQARAAEASAEAAARELSLLRFANFENELYQNIFLFVISGENMCEKIGGEWFLSAQLNLSCIRHLEHPTRAAPVRKGLGQHGRAP